MGVVEDGLAQDEVAVGGPGEVVEGVMRVLATEAAEDFAAEVGLTVAIGVLEEGHVGFLGDIDSTVAELEGEGNV